MSIAGSRPLSGAATLDTARVNRPSAYAAGRGWHRGSAETPPYRCIQVMGGFTTGRLLGVFLVALLLAAGGGVARAQPVDHYVLALSWSPTYCANEGRSRDSRQCGLEADYRFIVHGLWPNTANSAPAYCRTRHSGPSRRLIRAMLDIMPDQGLVLYQWRKHGTCSGLSAPEYFGLVRDAAERVVVPPGLATLRKTITVEPSVLREAFRRANPTIPEDGIYVACRGPELVDVRICLTTSLEPQVCPHVRNQRCRTRSLTISPGPG